MAVNKATPIPPWASVNIEPKRAFKFILTLGDIPAWVVKDAARPSPSFSGDVTHDFLGHQFRFGWECCRTLDTSQSLHQRFNLF